MLVLRPPVRRLTVHTPQLHVRVETIVPKCMEFLVEPAFGGWVQTNYPNYEAQRVSQVGIAAMVCIWHLDPCSTCPQQDKDRAGVASACTRLRFQKGYDKKHLSVDAAISQAAGRPSWTVSINASYMCCKQAAPSTPVVAQHASRCK